jgi:hypothetical protein
VVVGDLILLCLQWIGHPNKTNKETLESNDYRIFHSAQCTFFSGAHGTFSKIDHILCYKTSLNKYKKIKITPCILSDHNTRKLEFNNKRNNRK